MELPHGAGVQTVISRSMLTAELDQTTRFASGTNEPQNLRHPIPPASVGGDEYATDDRPCHCGTRESQLDSTRNSSSAAAIPASDAQDRARMIHMSRRTASVRIG